ncbi:hypothetical protein RB201_26460 [Streptomyces sp. S1A(2023)]
MDEENVHGRLVSLVNGLRDKYGEGTNSPCSSSSTGLFTDSCAATVAETRRVAWTAADLTRSDAQYKTLRSVTDKVLEAERGYKEAGCARNPEPASQRARCLTYGAVIAQAPVDLHQGVVAGLSGI